MSEKNQQNSDKIKNKPVTADAKPKRKAKVKRLDEDADKPEISSAGAAAVKTGLKSNLEAESSKPEAASAVIESGNDHPESETKNMDVAHHPQLEHKPKPFKEYLLEGFMIFIAVMMGFIAENVRETITNSEHARQLTAQLVQDLKADTTNLNAVLNGETAVCKSNDTLFSLLQQPLQRADGKKILKFISDSHSMFPFHPSDGAIAAIKNELHLKQFSNSKIIGYIANYESHVELLHTLEDITLEYQRSYLDPFLRLHFTPNDIHIAFNSLISKHGLPIKSAPMRNLTQEDLTQLGAEMVLIRINTNELITDNERLKKDAINLLHYIKKEYNVQE